MCRRRITGATWWHGCTLDLPRTSLCCDPLRTRSPAPLLSLAFGITQMSQHASRQRWCDLTGQAFACSACLTTSTSSKQACPASLRGTGSDGRVTASLLLEPHRGQMLYYMHWQPSPPCEPFMLPQPSQITCGITHDMRAPQHCTSVHFRPPCRLPGCTSAETHIA